jgi:hypothetical protein
MNRHTLCWSEMKVGCVCLFDAGWRRCRAPKHAPRCTRRRRERQRHAYKTSWRRARRDARISSSFSCRLRRTGIRRHAVGRRGALQKHAVSISWVKKRRPPMSTARLRTPAHPTHTACACRRRRESMSRNVSRCCWRVVGVLRACLWMAIRVPSARSHCALKQSTILCRT